MHLDALEYLIKFLVVLVLYDIWIGDKLKNNIKLHLIVATLATLGACLVNRYLGFNTGIVIFTVVFIESIVISRKYKREFIDTFSTFTLIFIIALIIKFLLETTMQIQYGMISEDIFQWITFIVVSAIVLLVTRILRNYKYKIQLQIIKNTLANAIIVNVFLFGYVIIVAVSRYNDNLEVLPQIIILCILIIAMNIIYIVNTQTKLDYANDIKKIDNMKILLEESVMEMKSKEHEYKNHLNVLYCIMQVTDESKLKERARDYIGNVYEKDKASDSINQIENTILRAIIFNTMYKCKIYNIAFTYNVEGDIENISLDDPEFTVLLSNLLNNAVEASRLSKDKFVEIDIYEEDDKYVIYVKNSIEKIDKQLASEILSGSKKSTKGEDRGYGVKNVMSIIKKCSGEISIEVVENFIEFVVEIPMKCK